MLATPERERIAQLVSGHDAFVGTDAIVAGRMQPYPPNRPPHPTQPPRQPVTRRPPDGRRSGLLKSLVILIFGLFTAVAMIGFVAAVGGAFVYSQGLKHPSELSKIVFPEDTIIYDRTGQKRLATLTVDGESRRTIGWNDVPPILADAVTAIEDKTFWANTGIDPIGILSAAFDTLTGDARGGSTITQQLVRQKLLPDEVVEGGRLGDRKIKEILQSIRVTDYYRGDEGKQEILTAYLNQNFYGNNSYGVRAAAKSYFGENNLNNLSLSEIATLAAIPQAPSTYDLVRNAVEDDQGNLYVPADSAIVRRRNLVLELLASDPSRKVISGNQYSTAQIEAAKDDVLSIVPQTASRWQAPHFVWYVREEMRKLICGEGETCDQLKQGGLRVTTTLDLDVQGKAEKWVEAAALVPHRANPAAAAKALGVPYADWMARLRGQNVWNAALSALDYQTGEIIAYVGSANYYERSKVSKKLQPQFDVLSDGWRQPGSAFKPFTYATGIDEKTLTGATMLMDVTTDFGGYTPTDFNGRERGPLRVRNALQFSLNIPAVKALALVGETDVFDRAQAFGMEFQRKRPTAGLAMGLGSLEVHPLDLNQSYATMANGGRNTGHTSILEIRDAGDEVLYKYDPPKGQQVISEQAAYVMTDILAGNTDPSVNPIWAENRITAGNGQRRPAALKTGTTNDAKDLNAYGYIAPPTAQGRKNGEYALSVGVWAGNSNSSPVTTVSNPVFSLDVAAPVWDAFLTEVTRSWAVNGFKRPSGITTGNVDAWTGAQPSQYSRRQVTELFIPGTSPEAERFIQPVQVVKGSDGKLYLWDESCEGKPTTRGYLVLDDAESQNKSWNNADRGWIKRARKGVGQGANVSSSKRTYTAYFYEPYFQPYGQSWGGPFAPKRSCSKAPTESPSPSPEASSSPSPSIEPSPALSPSPTESATPTAEPTPKPTKTPKPTPEPTAKPTATPPPTAAPTAAPSPAPSKTPKPSTTPTIGPAASLAPAVEAPVASG